MERWLTMLYFLGGLATTIFLTFFDGYPYSGWNWLVAVPVNLFLGMMWPIYWIGLRWMF